MDLLTLARSYSYYSSSSDIDSIFSAIGLIFSMLFGVIIVALIVVVLIYAAYWAIMKKAGKDGWDGIIPIHNEVCLLEICGIPKYMWLINFIPWFGQLAFCIILSIYMAKSFGKSGGYAVGLIFLPFVFYPMLAWGNAQYIGKTWGVAPQPQYQPQYQPQQPQYQQPMQQPVQPQQPVNDGTFQQYQAPQQPMQPQQPDNTVPPQQ